MKRRNLWAPWRTKYVRSLGEEKECFICAAAAADRDKDSETLLLWRTGKSIVMFNRYPYNNGHLLIAPVRHIANFAEADDELLELTKLMRESQKVLNLAVQPHGFNIGMNFGRCAGAGLPEHMHIHVVPRWDGDCSFMSVCSDTDVISQGLSELFDELKDISEKNNLPNL